MIENAIRFVQESYQELKMSNWLSREQMINSTLVVIGLTFVVAIYVSLIDRVLLWVVGHFYKIG